MALLNVIKDEKFRPIDIAYISTEKSFKKNF